MNKTITLGIFWFVSIVTALFVGSSMQSNQQLPMPGLGANSNSSGQDCTKCDSAQSNTQLTTKTNDDELAKKVPSTKARLTTHQASISEISDALQLHLSDFDYGNYENYRAIADSWDRVKNLSEEEVLELYSSINDNSENGITRTTAYMLYSRLAQVNPTKALEHAQESKKEYAMHAIFKQWSQSDPFAALDWINENNDKVPGNYRFESNIFEKIAEVDTKKALEHLENLDKARRNSALQGILKTLKDPGEFKSLANIIALKDGGGQQLQSVLSSWSKKNPMQALEFTETIDNDKEKQNAIRKIKHSWMREKPEEASKWIMANTEDKTKGLQDVVNGWSWKQGSQALEFIDNQDGVENKDRAYETYVSRFSWSDTKNATVAVDYISDLKTRKRAVERLYRTMRHRSDQAAQEFLDNRDELTSEEKEKLQSKSRRH